MINTAHIGHWIHLDEYVEKENQKKNVCTDCQSLDDVTELAVQAIIIAHQIIFHFQGLKKFAGVSLHWIANIN